MQFLNNRLPSYELTYSDAFLVPGPSNLNSRFDIDITPLDKTGSTIPLVIANMNAVAGKRMSETVGRRGGLTVLPQDVPLEIVSNIVNYQKSRHLIYETPLTLYPTNTIMDAMNILHKRSHRVVIIVNEKNQPIGIFSERDGEGYDRFTPLSVVMTKNPVTVPNGLTLKEIFNLLHSSHLASAPVVKAGKVVGIVSQKGILRSEIFKPAVNKKNQMLTAVAIGINGDVAAKAEVLLQLGVDILVLDTAHGHQQKMIDAVKTVRSVSKKVTLVAGNVVTARATTDLIKAGVNIVKVGVGPGAMCTTRVMTAVGRPQFSAVVECAKVARDQGANIWADGGIRYPRDVALALAAGASNVMIGSMMAGTYESVGDMQRDSAGRLYKENFGMASKRAVRARTKDEPVFQQMKKEFFEEGIGTSKLYIDEDRAGVEDVIDYIVAGLRSAVSYSGARNLEEFNQKAIIGVQSPAGFAEGLPNKSSWV